MPLGPACLEHTWRHGNISQRELMSHDEFDDPWQKSCLGAGQFVWQVGKWHILNPGRSLWLALGKQGVRKYLDTSVTMLIIWIRQ